MAQSQNTDAKLLFYGLFQKGRVLAQDAVTEGPTPLFGGHGVDIEKPSLGNQIVHKSNEPGFKLVASGELADDCSAN